MSPTKEDHSEMYKENQLVHLQQLSEDTLSHILGYLDARSKVRAWDTCVELRRAMHRRNLVRRVSLRYWRLPRVIYDFLRENTLYIEELDLSCAKGLSEELAVSALTRLENLRSLDITHTAVTLRGASAVCAACPRLLRLACNFRNVTPSLTPLSEPKRESFKNLEYVHFVANPLTSDPFDVLTLCCLKEFKLTTGHISERNSSLLECLKSGASQHPTLRSITYHIIKFSLTVLSLREYFETTAWDFLIAKNFARDRDVSLSPRLHRTATSSSMRARARDSACNIFHMDSSRDYIMGPGCMLDVYAWRSDLIQRNPYLHTDVLQEVYSKLPQKICCKTFTASKAKDSYFISPCTFKDSDKYSEKLTSDLNIAEFIPPNRKISVSYSFLKLCCENVKNRCNAILGKNFPVLRNIVNLTLGEVNFDYGLFEVLFKECVNLETLSVRVTHAGSIENIRHSRSMRNILIKGKILHSEDGLPGMLRALGACPSLEMVYICDSSSSKKLFDLKEVDFEAFFQNCPNLCSLYIHCGTVPKSETYLRNAVRRITERQGRGDLNFRLTHSEKHRYNSLEMMSLYLPSRIFYERFNLELEVNESVDYS